MCLSTFFACFQNKTLSKVGDKTLVVQNQVHPTRLHSFTLIKVIEVQSNGTKQLSLRHNFGLSFSINTDSKAHTCVR